MATVPEFELEQRVSDFIQFVKDYTANKKDDFKLVCKRDKAVLLCIDKDVTLDFTV